MQARNRLVKHPDVEEEGDEIAQFEVGIGEHVMPADVEHDHAAERTDEGASSRVNRPGAHDHQLGLADEPGGPREAFQLGLLAGVGFDLAYALEVIEKKGVHVGRGLALGAIAGADGGGVPDGAGEEEGHRNQHPAREHRVEVKENHADSEHLQQRDDALFDAIDEDAFHAGDVVDDAGDDVAGGALVVPAQGQFLERGVEVAAKIEDDGLFEGVVEADAEDIEAVAQEEGGDDEQDVGEELFRLLLGEDVIEDQAGDFGVDEAGQAARNGGAHGGKEEERIGAGIEPDAAEGFHVGKGRGNITTKSTKYTKGWKGYGNGSE